MGSKYLIIKIGKFFFIACDVCVNVKKFDDSLIENFFSLVNSRVHCCDLHDPN